MWAKGLRASRIRAANLVISAVLSEAVRDKKLAESACVAIALHGVVIEKDFIMRVAAVICFMLGGVHGPGPAPQ